MAKTRIPLDLQWVAEQKKAEVLASAVAELELDVRTVNGLEEVGVLYVSELIELTRAELDAIPNFGSKSVERILRALGEHGLAIRSDSGRQLASKARLCQSKKWCSKYVPPADRHR